MRDPLDQIRLRDLLLLEHVHELGTLKLAAQALFVTQPAVTQMLKGLELAFGMPLVERGRRGVRLNAAGAAALVRLRCARQELGLAREAARSSQHPLLRLGATPIATLQLLPQAIRRMRERLPEVRLTLAETGVESLWQQLAEGTLDALLGRLPGQDPHYPQVHGLRHEPVGTQRMVLVAGRQHPLARSRIRPGNSRAWKQALAACDWILPSAEGLSVIHFNDWFAQSGIAPPVPVVVSGSIYANLNMVSAAPLLTAVPESAALSLCDALRLKILETAWSNPPVQIVFAARSTNWDTATIQGLRACLAP